MELIIQNEIDILKNVECNFEEIKSKLQEKMVTYKGLVYNDEQIANAKADKANLNKLKTEIEDKRKDVKKTILLPYDSFELKIKELVKLIDEPITEIGKQVTAYEDKIKAERKKIIEAFFTSEIGDCELKLNRIWQDKWLNISLSLKKVQEEVMGHIAYFKRDIEVITNLQSKHFEQLKKTYLATYDLGLVMTEKNKLDEAEKTVIAVQQKEAEQVKVVEQEKKEIPQQEVVATGMSTFTIKVTTDKERMQLLKDFILFNQISYERIS
jgi:hypothetical protein